MLPLNFVAVHLQGVTAKSTPAASVNIVYGQQVQYETIDTAPPLDAARKQLLMEIVGCKMYVARVVQYDVLTATCKLASEQAHATEETWTKAIHLLAYDKGHLDSSALHFLQHLSVAPAAPFLHPEMTQRLPPPWAEHLSVMTAAAFFTAGDGRCARLDSACFRTLKKGMSKIILCNKNIPAICNPLAP